MILGKADKLFNLSQTSGKPEATKTFAQSRTCTEMASTVPQTLFSSQKDARHSCLTLHTPQGKDGPCGHSHNFTFSLTKGLNTWKTEKRSRGFSSLTVQSVDLKHFKLFKKSTERKTRVEATPQQEHLCDHLYQVSKGELLA